MKCVHDLIFMSQTQLCSFNIFTESQYANIVPIPVLTVSAINNRYY